MIHFAVIELENYIFLFASMEMVHHISKTVVAFLSQLIAQLTHCDM